MMRPIARVWLSAAVCLLFAAGSLPAAAGERGSGFHGWGGWPATSKRAGQEMPGKAAGGTPAAEKESDRPAGAGKNTSPSTGAAEEAAGGQEELARRLEAAREAFFEDTKGLRLVIYQKRLELRHELSKTAPDEQKALGLQKAISDLKAQLARKRLEHLLDLRQRFPELGRAGSGGFHRFGRRGPWGMDAPCGPMMGGPMMGGPWNEGAGMGGGRGMGRMPMGPAGETEGLSLEQARDIVSGYLRASRNPNLKLGEVTEAGDAYEAEILTKDGSLADKVLVDRLTGYLRPAY